MTNAHQAAPPASTERPFLLTADEVRAFVTAEQSDLFLINGPMQRGLDFDVIGHVNARKKHSPNATLILVTPGGDAHVAYRIARCFQQHYKKFTCVISGYCKSAGTILATGAHRLVFGPCGELGPIDGQMGKTDEYDSRESGLIVMAALNSLNAQVTDIVAERLKQLKKQGIPSKVAENIAKETTMGTYAPIFAQISPSRVGEAGRALSVAHQYGRQLGAIGGNLKNETLNILVGNYSDHGSVIDRHEAAGLFKEVTDYQDILGSIVAKLGNAALIPVTEAPRYFFPLSSEGDIEVSNDQGNNTAGGNHGTAIMQAQSHV